MLLPEVELYNGLFAGWKTINADWEDNGQANPELTYLYDLFGVNEANQDIELTQRYNFFEQAQSILLKSCEKGRLMALSLGYNLQREGLPTVHILLPAEQTFDGSGIGSNEGYIVSPAKQAADGRVQGKYTASNYTTYNCFITSANYLEVVIIYHWLKYSVLALIDHFSLLGFQNIKLSGSDVSMIDEEIIPTHIFHRSLNISFSFEFSAISYSAYQGRIDSGEINLG